MTWLFDVDLEFEYLVRLYFCDIVSPTPRKLFFNVYINALAVVSDFDLSGKTSNILGVPYFMDVIMKTSKIRALNVSIGRSTGICFVEEEEGSYPMSGIRCRIVSMEEGICILGSWMELPFSRARQLCLERKKEINKQRKMKKERKKLTYLSMISESLQA